MRRHIQGFKNYWESDNSFIVLLIMLLFAVFILPVLIDSEEDSLLLLNGFFILLFIMGIFSAKDRAFFVASIVMISAHLLLRGIRFADNPFEYYWLERVVIILNLVLFIVINSRLLFRDYEVNLYRVLGAVNIYLLLALVGAFAFELIYLTQGEVLEGSISLRGKDKDYSEYIYYSLAAISTLGMGDVYPVTSSSKMLTVFLSTIGILYPAVVIARLISFTAAKKITDSN